MVVRTAAAGPTCAMWTVGSMHGLRNKRATGPTRHICLQRLWRSPASAPQGGTWGVHNRATWVRGGGLVSRSVALARWSAWGRGIPGLRLWLQNFRPHFAAWGRRCASVHADV